MRLCLLLLMCFPVFVSLSVRADPAVLVGCSLSVPPYVIRQNHRGITLDLLRQALAHTGLSMRMHYDSNEANVDAFNQGRLDALCITNRASTPNAFFSAQPLMTFRNVAISLESRDIGLVGMNDLSRYRVQGFSLASRLLPDDFSAAVAKAPSYVEQADQMEQVRALFRDETDVVVMEYTIFRYFLSQLRRAEPENRAYQQPYRHAELFRPTEYHAAFRSEVIRDRFDAGHRQLKASGEEQRITDAYQQLLDDYLFR